jgi:hypothetical protein
MTLPIFIALCVLVALSVGLGITTMIQIDVSREKDVKIAALEKQVDREVQLRSRDSMNVREFHEELERITEKYLD